MSEPLATDMQRYINLAHEIVVDSVLDAEKAPIEELVDFWMTWVYWELQLYSGLQQGIDATWARVQTQPGILQPAVLNLYTAFRFRAGLDEKHWQRLVELLADSGSLKVRTGSGIGTFVGTPANKDIWDRSLVDTNLEEALLANGWMVPILLYKMGPRPISLERKRRGNTSM